MTSPDTRTDAAYCEEVVRKLQARTVTAPEALWQKDCQQAAALITALSVRVDELERANRTRPDYDLRCDECGRAHILDTSLPSEIWNQIAEPVDVLCTVCIDARLAAKGLTAEAEFYYAGTALNSKMYAEAAEARLAEVEGEFEAYKRDGPDTYITTANYDRLVANEASLAEALDVVRPFAKAADIGWSSLTVDDLLAARALLAKHGGGDGHR